MSLIRDIDASPCKQALVKSMLQVCQGDLAIKVVCEGVETAAELEALVGIGASLVQGYLFARPQRDFLLASDEARKSEQRLAVAKPHSIAR